MKARGLFSKDFAFVLAFFLLICQGCAVSPPHEPAGNTFIKRYDKNGDGRVSRKEYPGAERIFNQLDKNRDGFIDAAEAPSESPPPRRR